jgi:hypothetical protein
MVCRGVVAGLVAAISIGERGALLIEITGTSPVRDKPGDDKLLGTWP